MSGIHRDGIYRQLTRSMMTCLSPFACYNRRGAKMIENVVDKQSSKINPGTRLFSCSCTSDYQDKKYGNGIRLHNAALKSQKYRCTVCMVLR